MMFIFQRSFKSNNSEIFEIKKENRAHHIPVKYARKPFSQIFVDYLEPLHFNVIEVQKLDYCIQNYVRHCIQIGYF